MKFRCYSVGYQQPNEVCHGDIIWDLKQNYFISVQSLDVAWSEVHKQLRERKVKRLTYYNFRTQIVSGKKNVRTRNLDVTLSKVNKKLRIPFDLLSD